MLGEEASQRGARGPSPHDQEVCLDDVPVHKHCPYLFTKLVEGRNTGKIP